MSAATTSCLVLSTPERDDPVQTAPLLLATNASPDPRVIKQVGPEQSVLFSAEVLSEDTGSPVEVHLFLDYGEPNVKGQVFQAFDAAPDMAAGTLADGPRPLSVLWYPAITHGPTTPNDPSDDDGCHTVTLMVSHGFDTGRSECPLRAEDSSQLTWQVVKCAVDTSLCASIETARCPTVSQVCPDVVGDSDGGTP